MSYDRNNAFGKNGKTYNQNNGKPRQEPFCPLPGQMREKLKNPNCNFSLYSPRMVSWKIVNNWNGLKADESAISGLYKQSEKLFSAAGDFISKKQERQSAYIAALKEQGVRTFTFRAKTASPLITGLGSGHPTETGMILDRNTGVPYIPASSIKGVLRLACAVNLARTNEQYANGIVPENDKTLVKFFGSTVQDGENQTRGQLIFLDAFPAKSVRLKPDIMNPHFGKYYSGEHKQPVETESPVPIKFLAVQKGTEFVFNCAFMPLKADETCGKEEIDKLFKTAFEEIGFGGKTAIGYGRFKVLEEK